MSAGTGSLATTRAVRPGGGPARGTRVRRSAADLLPAAVVAVVALVTLEWVLPGIGVRSFLVPRPSQVVAALGENWSSGRFALVPAAMATLQEAVLGLLIGTTATPTSRVIHIAKSILFNRAWGTDKPR